MIDLAKRLDKLPNSALTTLYNQVSARQVTKFSDHTTAVKRTQMALEAAGKDFEPDTLLVVEVGSVSVGDDRVITVLVKENPKRAGSKAAARFAKYKTGMTVGAYVRAVRETQERRHAIRDLDWDVKHGYVSVK